MLLTYLESAVDRVEPLAPEHFSSTEWPRVGSADVIRLTNAIASMREPVALVLDNAETITNRECRDMIAELALRLSPGSVIAIGSRREVPVAISRLRAHGTTLEVGVEHLKMEFAEAQRLLAAAGIELGERDVIDLVERTEGWPAGLYLAALTMNAGGSHVDAAHSFTGGDRFVGDYLRSEFLSRVSRADASFLVRTSILERLSGPLCDFTVGTNTSGRVLDRLERSNLLVIPLDRRGEWYRYHHLFRDLLQTELQRREPEMVSELHARAAIWYEANGFPQGAIAHAQHAGDAVRVARLVLNAMNPVWASGRMETVLRWIEWFPTKVQIEDHPAIAVHGALIYALVGNAGEAERWATAAERTTIGGLQSDGNTVEGTLAYLHALTCRNGMETMARDAESALEGLSPTSPYRPAMLHAIGSAHLLTGELDAADLSFGRALDEATGTNVPFVRLLLAERGMIATRRNAWAEADALARQVDRMLADGDYRDYWTSALAYAWCAQVAAIHGDATRARELAADAARLRPLLTYALPVVSVQALAQLARAYIALADPGGASAVLGQANEILQHRPDLGTLRDQVSELCSSLETLKVEMVGASSLTSAELCLLPFLPTYLTLAEIAERLFVSRATVKARSISVYRKLNVSSRGEAVSRLQQVGLAPALADTP